MKRLCMLAATILLTALLLCACGPALPAAEPMPIEPAPAPETPETTLPATTSTPSVVRLNMATGGTSGTYYSYGSALALSIEESTGYIKPSISATGASVENMQQIAKGRTDLAIVQNDVLYYAYNATQIWTAEPVKNVTALMSLYPEYCHLVVAEGCGIESVADLRGKRVSIGDIGSGVEVNAKQILAVYGLTPDDFYVRNLGFAESAQSMKNGGLDAFFVTSGVPNTAVMELSTFCKINLISIGDEAITSLLDQYPFYTKDEISDNVYSFLSEPVKTVSMQAVLVANPDLAEQVAYDIVKTIFEDKNAIRVSHAKGAYINTEYALQGICVELHPGARRYFEEIGAL